MLPKLTILPLVLGTLILATAPAVAEEKLQAVATFSILGDLTQRVGGEAVSVTTLVGPDQDAHGFDPTAADQRAVAGAEILIANGLGYETWLDRLTEAAGFKGRLVVASDGIDPLPWQVEEEHGDDHAEGSAEENHDEHDMEEHGHDEHSHDADEHDHGAVDPHAFQDAHLVLTYIDNIAAGLAAARPADAALFRQNAEALKAEFAVLDADLKASLAAIPAERRRILTSHDAFGYFARAYGIDFVGLQGVSTETEPSAQDLKAVIEQIKAGRITAVFLENMSDPRFVETLAADTGVKIGGELYADALSRPDGPAPDLLALFRHNQRQLLDALQ